MADIKKFTGFLTSDGKTHNTQGAAVTHERELKMRKALEEAFSTLEVVSNVPISDGGMLGAALADFLFENRVTVLAALNPEVLLRKKRTQKTRPAVTTTTTSPTQPAAQSAAGKLPDGIFDLDE